jgi:hypothetical protein
MTEQQIRKDERKKIVSLINEYAAKWRKPTSFNFRTELFKLVDLINQEK